MEKVVIKPTDNTLGVNLNGETGVLEMEGISYPENASRFFQPINRWLEAYISEVGKPITLNLRFNYLNSTSTKHILDILETLEEFHEGGGKVMVNWYYESSDYNIQEMGEDFAEDLSLPFELITY